jgi:hypothetical protein
MGEKGVVPQQRQHGMRAEGVLCQDVHQLQHVGVQLRLGRGEPLRLQGVDDDAEACVRLLRVQVRPVDPCSGCGSVPSFDVEALGTRWWETAEHQREPIVQVVWMRIAHKHSEKTKRTFCAVLDVEAQQHVGEGGQVPL